MDLNDEVSVSYFLVYEGRNVSREDPRAFLKEEFLLYNNYSIMGSIPIKPSTDVYGIKH
jgi:hypothetical protein